MLYLPGSRTQQTDLSTSRTSQVQEGKEGEKTGKGEKTGDRLDRGLD